MSADRILGGRYVLRRVLGQGGMAVVHLARDICLERPVAVKVLRSDLARDPMHRYRFRREAQALARLDHPGIVTVYDVGQEDADGDAPDGWDTPFIVMEYVAGQSLRGRLREQTPTLAESVRYLTAVLAALEASHRAGIVHRDLKPANVMVTPDGVVKVVDFGIAHLVSDPVATTTQGFLGSAEYVSPEQAQGRSTDARSDLYSAGCLLFELLTGRPPFVGDHAVAVAYQHVHADPPRASTYRAEITPELDEVLLTTLAKDPSARFQSARSFDDALRSATRGLTGPGGDADTGPGHAVVPLPLRSVRRDGVSPATATGAGLRSAAGVT